MKNLIIISILFALVTGNAQNSESSKSVLQNLVANHKIFLKSDWLKREPYYKKSVFNFLKKEINRKCEVDLDIGFVIYKKNDTYFLVADDLNSNLIPLSQNIPINQFNIDNIFNFLVNAVKTYQNRQTCDICIQNFLYDYSEKIVDNSFATSLFTFQDQGKEKHMVSDYSGENKQMLIVPFPVGATPGGSYTITQGDAQINGEFANLYLPADFTIFVDPSVTEINWTFNKLIFENNTTIDLSHRDVINQTPDTPAKVSINAPCTVLPQGNDREWSTACVAGYNGQNGQNGILGSDGTNGINGTNLNLISNLITTSNGSLWIRTDGSNGGDGGNGGDADDGAYGNCGNGIFPKGTDGGNGGDGGYGGKGGNGGNTSIVSLIVINGTTYVTTPSLPNTYTPSTRPGQLTGNTGLVAIYGNPGNGGNGGYGGNGGKAGPRRGCNNTANSYAGNPGTSRINVKAPNGQNGKGYPDNYQTNY